MSISSLDDLVVVALALHFTAPRVLRQMLLEA
jgi:hypothetical protein